MALTTLLAPTLERMSYHQHPTSMAMAMPPPPMQPAIAPAIQQTQARYVMVQQKAVTQADDVRVLNWKTILNIADTYIWVILVTVGIYYFLNKFGNFLINYAAKEDPAGADLVTIIGEIFVNLALVFMISIAIAILIKMASDIRGAMAYSKIVNQQSAEKNSK